MKDKIIEWLKEANLLRNDNYFFTASTLKIPEEYVLYRPFIINEKDEEFFTYVINYTEEGLGILPLESGIKYNLATFVPFENITKVDIKKELFYTKVYIIIDSNKILSLRVNKKDVYLKEHKNNFQKFLKDYLK